MLSTGLPQGAVPKLERPGPLREQVYEALLELITTRALQPGQHLVESELAGHLGVSRQPVREALQRLNTEGWVDLRPAQGAFVHEPTEDEADQLLTVRTLLEAEAARLAAANSRQARDHRTRRALRQGRAGRRRRRRRAGRRHERRLPRQGHGTRGQRRPGRARRTGRPPCALVLPAGGPSARQAVLDRAPRADRGDRAADEARATAVMRAHTEHTRETYHRRDQS